MSALVVIGTFCIRFVYMGGFLFNEIITYQKKKNPNWGEQSRVRVLN
jgi:hypothetical protein